MTWLKERRMFKFSQTTLNIHRLLSATALILLIVYGELWQWGVVFAVHAILAIIGLIIYHRYLAHRSYNCPSWFLNMGMIISIIGPSAPAIIWVAVHRLHHKNPDTQADPHSPHHKSFSEMMFSKFNTPEKVYFRLVPDLAKMPIVMWTYNYFWLINIAYVLLIAFTMGWFAITYMYFVPGALKPIYGGLSNIVTHKWGYRNYDTEDKSTNPWWIYFMNYGDTWHNNHHYAPTSANYGKHWWEFDINFWIIKFVCYVSGTKYNDAFSNKDLQDKSS